MGNVVPIDSRRSREARGVLGSIDPMALRIAIDMARRQNVVGTEREAQFAADLRLACVEFEMPVADVSAFVAAFLDEVRNGSPV